MTYIDKNLVPDERILFRTKKHLIIFFFPVVLLIFSAYATSYMQGNALLIKVQWAPWLITLLFWAHTWLEYQTSDFAVTNKRVIMREGFFNRHMAEMRLSTISQVNIDQGILGQMLNFGTISINAFGATDAFTMLARPNEFQRAVNEQLDKLVK